MELISKISKGSVMDQIYIPKNRQGFVTGSYVVIKSLDTEREKTNPFFYNVNDLEPIKVRIVNDVFKIINSYAQTDNIIITGSFLEQGFQFNDVDVLIIKKEKTNIESLKQLLENNLGIKFHLILITNKELIRGLETDPLYKAMLSKSIAKKRFVYNVKPKINYKLLDIHLLKSELLILNFDFLTGQQKYDMLRNAVVIDLFIEKKELNKINIDKEIKKLFNLDVKTIKDNLIEDKKDFSEKYNRFYKEVFSKIMNGVKNDSKQK